jgi:hypothetical protein
MANRAYLGAWLRDFTADTLLARLEQFLAAAPLTAGSSFTSLVIQAVDPSEPPLAEWDLRGQGFSASDVVALARDHVHSDTAYLVGAQWDLWALDLMAGRWTHSAAPLTILCQGPDYDSGAYVELGHFHADLGFEHLFTGHAGVLRARRAEGTLRDGVGTDGPARPAAAGHGPAEEAFRTWLVQGQNVREYHEKTRENIQQLFSWVRGLEQALPVERVCLWSEGEENFEARLDEILARR